jgi:hypothetical protein
MGERQPDKYLDPVTNLGGFPCGLAIFGSIFADLPAERPFHSEKACAKFFVWTTLPVSPCVFPNLRGNPRISKKTANLQGGGGGYPAANRCTGFAFSKASSSA